jgi:hypothetical protein
LAAFISRYCSIIGVTRAEASATGVGSGGKESDDMEIEDMGIEDWIVIRPFRVE